MGAVKAESVAKKTQPMKAVQAESVGKTDGKKFRGILPIAWDIGAIMAELVFYNVAFWIAAFFPIITVGMVGAIVFKVYAPALVIMVGIILVVSAFQRDWVKAALYQWYNWTSDTFILFGYADLSKITFRDLFTYTMQVTTAGAVMVWIGKEIAWYGGLEADRIANYVALFFAIETLVRLWALMRKVIQDMSEVHPIEAKPRSRTDRNGRKTNKTTKMITFQGQRVLVKLDRQGKPKFDKLGFPVLADMNDPSNMTPQERGKFARFQALADYAERNGFNVGDVQMRQDGSFVPNFRDNRAQTNNNSGGKNNGGNNMPWVNPQNQGKGGNNQPFNQPQQNQSKKDKQNQGGGWNGQPGNQGNQSNQSRNDWNQGNQGGNGGWNQGNQSNQGNRSNMPWNNNFNNDD